MSLAKWVGMAAWALMSSGRSPNVNWHAIEAWISANSKRDGIGRGFALGRPAPPAPFNAFVELIRESVGKDSWKVTASVYFDQRQGAFASKTWGPGKPDSELKKTFGRSLRKRIPV